MGLFETLPYANFHELNLDWILKAVKQAVVIVKSYDDRLTSLEERLESFKKILGEQLAIVLNEMLENGDFDTIFQTVASITNAEIDTIVGGEYNA